MVGMVILAFFIGYPLFMLIAFGLARFLFPNQDTVADALKKERELLYQRAKRPVRTRSRRQVITPTRPAFTLNVSNPRAISNEYR